MARFVEVLNDPLQKTGEYWQQAEEILISAPSAALEHVAVDENMYIATLPVIPAAKYRYDQTEWEELPSDKQVVLGQEYQIAARTDGRKTYLRGDPLYLIVNGNFRIPLFKFGEHSDRLAVLNDGLGHAEDTDEHLPEILETIAKAVSERQRAVEREQSEKRRHRRTVASVIGSMGLLLGAVGGGYQGLQNRREADRERAAVERDEYDANNVDLPAIPIHAGDLGFIISDLSIFSDEIPRPSKNDSFEHPRSVKLSNSDDCTYVTELDPETHSAVAVTDAAGESLSLVVNSAGTVRVCYLDGDRKSESGEGGESDPRVAVQVVPKPEQPA